MHVNPTSGRVDSHDLLGSFAPKRAVRGRFDKIFEF